MSPAPGHSPEASLIYVPASYTVPFNFSDLFRVSRPVEVELGSGDGSFLAQYAKGKPEINFLGVERLLGRARKLDRKGLRAGLGNLRVVRIEASYLLEYLLSPVTVSALHVYFPDPWPKRRHHKNRLINRAFPALAARVLIPGGKIFLRTDNLDYFQQMQDVFGGAGQFKNVETDPDLRMIATDFERVFNAQGISTLTAAYELTA